MISPDAVSSSDRLPSAHRRAANLRRAIRHDILDFFVRNTVPDLKNCQPRHDSRAAQLARTRA